MRLIRTYIKPGLLVGKSAGLVMERLRVRIPAGERETFLLHNYLCVLTLIRCPFHPRAPAVAHKRPGSFCQKCRWQVTCKHAYTLDPTKSEWVDYAAI